MKVGILRFCCGLCGQPVRCAGVIIRQDYTLIFDGVCIGERCGKSQQVVIPLQRYLKEFTFLSNEETSDVTEVDEGSVATEEESSQVAEDYRDWITLVAYCPTCDEMADVGMTFLSTDGSQMRIDARCQTCKVTFSRVGSVSDILTGAKEERDRLNPREIPLEEVKAVGPIM